MAKEALQGVEKARALFGALPEAAREQMGVELAIIGREILADQRALVPKDTGRLESGLSIAASIEKLRVRVGLIGVKRPAANGRTAGKRNYADFYYGRFVNFGRRAQTVLVTRRGFRGRGKKYDTTRFYKLRVKAEAPREFIQVPGAEATALGQLREFWERTFARAEGGA